jgi:hypothetical protein
VLGFQAAIAVALLSSSQFPRLIHSPLNVLYRAKLGNAQLVPAAYNLQILPSLSKNIKKIDQEG